MKNILWYPIGVSDSCRYAAGVLEDSGFALIDHPAPEITHLLVDVPHKNSDMDLKEILRMLPRSVTVVGGRLPGDFLKGCRTHDLLQDPMYLAKNAAITADCALRVSAPYLHSTFADAPALILGWGRIGKCLGKVLSGLGCPVTVAARKAQDRAMLEALGYEAVDFSEVSRILPRCKLLYNTVPDLPYVWDLRNVIAIDLASEPGMQGDRVIAARGLPGKYVPESSGRLIAETILRYHKEGIL